MIQMGVGNDDGVSLHRLGQWHRQLDQRVSQLAVVRPLKTRVCPFLGQHWVDEEGVAADSLALAGVAALAVPHTMRVAMPPRAAAFRNTFEIFMVLSLVQVANVAA